MSSKVLENLPCRSGHFAVCDLIGTVKLNIGVWYTYSVSDGVCRHIRRLLGPDIFKVFKTEECKIGGSLVLVVLAPFMAKNGHFFGANLAKLVSVGPALHFFRNSETLERFFYLCLALLLGLKKESIGACYSINRDSNLGLTTDILDRTLRKQRNLCSLYCRFCNRNSVYQYSCKRCSFLEYF